MDRSSPLARLAERIARDAYGLTDISIQPLAGEKDATLRVAAAEGAYVLKITEPLAANEAPRARAAIDLQDAALAHVAAHAHGVAVQRVVPARDGSTILEIDEAGERRFGRLFTFLPGRLWATCNPRTPEMRRALGHALGEVDTALQSFSHPAAERDLKWDLSRANWIRDHLHHVADPRRRALVARWLADYEQHVQPRLGALRRQVIYNDANDHNIVLIHPAGGAGDAEPGIGLIDFGDVIGAPLVCDLAIACAYAVLDLPDPLSAAAEVVEGFHRAFPLTEAELAVLFPLIAMRLSVSVVNAAWQGTLDPANDYAQISARPAWAALEVIEHIQPRFAHYALRAACGLTPVPHGPAVLQWLREHADAIAPVVLPDLRTCPKIYADWSVGSLELGSPEDYADAATLTKKLWARMAEAGARVAIGGYGHARPVYGGSAFRAACNDGVEWRTIHLGLDVFMDAGSPVFAPLDGIVHSVAFNDAKYDYGPCVVLKHTITNTPDTTGALTFYTLYGHLTPDSLDGQYEGKPIAKGEAFARIGTYPSNGDWPPHLHLQVVMDMLDRRGDFDGSCRPSQRRVWLGLCPDPNVLARIPERELPPAERVTPAWLDDSGESATAALLDARRRRIGRNLSVSYRRKLHIVRGWKQWLYDAEGQRYLDCVNNVAHVGHCHPDVVRAGQAQMAVLNTNTRYLHEKLVEYARRLTETLPEPLRVCYFVNSGSEANELALRLARAHTRQKDMIVVDVGYHGNTTSVIDISPYKHNHAGGMGAPDWVHVAPIPDVYRGSFAQSDPRAGAKYAAPIAELIERAAALPQHDQAAGAHVTWRPERRVAGFICESVLSCGGQIVLPDGYLAEAYRLVRAAGGVCIADEVQTGFGRAGAQFWAFELQGVTPDIVTLGKPMGNGHPLGAVVTTPEIAASFDNGLEYFNTFGGNPVSCAIGLAVLDVIEREGLQAHAQRVGEHLRAELRRLMDEHEIIGDVRGVGLFDGFELVRDRASKAPATAEASALVNRMRDLGILLSTDGPFENVIKIKPPLCFSQSDVDQMVTALDQVLREDAIRSGRT